jgi:hypothetical protein
MKWVAFFLLFLTLAAGCVLEDKPVIPEDGGVEAGVCGLCPLDMPVCNDDFDCVECTAQQDAYCQDETPVCKTDVFDCVQCNASSDCNDPDAARCNTETNACEGCQGESDCIGIDGLPRCEAGTCVECTPATEAITCPNRDSCNPITNECSGIQEGSRLTCQLCVSDRDCGEEGNRCVPMNYQEQRYPNEESGFCLKSIDLGGACTNPYRIVINRPSLSGAEPDDYCVINEDLATCPAVRALLDDRPCDPMNGDLDCPQPSGRCRELPGMVNGCTYFCGLPAQCPADAPVNTCGVGSGGAGGAGGHDYCGG